VKTIINLIASATFGLLLKLFSVVAAAAFGILGLGSKTHESSGTLTRKGRIALVGVITAGILGVGTTMIFRLTSEGQRRIERKTDSCSWRFNADSTRCVT
jgi:hypothetical protein